MGMTEVLVLLEFALLVVFAGSELGFVVVAVSVVDGVVLALVVRALVPSAKAWKGNMLKARKKATKQLATAFGREKLELRFAADSTICRFSFVMLKLPSLPIRFQIC